MKHSLPLFFLFFLFVSCEKSIEQQINQPITDNHHIDLELALDCLDSFLSEMNIETRQSGLERRYSVDNIEIIRGEQLEITTRADSSMNSFPDEVFYLVNFDDSLGSAVLAADDRMCDIVLCVTENGTLNSDDFRKALDLYGDRFPARTDTTVADEMDADICGTLGECVVPAILLSSAVHSIKNNGNGNVASKTRSLSSSVKYGPFVPTKWSQSYVGADKSNYVFNRYTPNHYPAGCVAIATAQILLANTNFTFTGNDGYSCYRNTMITVANYMSPRDPGTYDAQLQAGKFVYYLGGSSLCNISYGKDGSSGNANGAKRALSAFMYNDVTKRTGFGSANQSRATAQLRKGLPVYLDGNAPGLFSKGHAWVLDGEWGDYYHVNWGWSGACDGYYSKGVFDTSQRKDIDSVVDSNVTVGISGSESFTWCYRMITYSL